MNSLKIIIILYSLILLNISIESVTSDDRIISSSNDNIMTFIRCDNGRYWESTVDNIQVAINQCNNKTHTIWLPGNTSFIITSTIRLYKNIILDMNGCSFYTTNNIDVLDMRDGSTIQNGNIDVSDVGSSFNKAAILIEAVNYIEQGVSILNMNLDSKGPLGIPNSYGRGTGIYLHASNNNIPQKITNVRCEGLYTRDFYYGIRIHNERNPNTGEHGAIINGNTFTNLISMADSYYIHISRNTAAPLDLCNTSGNYFDVIQYQTGRSGWYGGEHFTWTVITSDGFGNSFNNVMIWDWSLAEGVNSVIFTSDTRNCYIMGRGSIASTIDNGFENTILNTGTGSLKINSIIQG